MQNKLTKLEAIRGFAAFYVVLHHLIPKKFFFFGIDIFGFGQEAVILFFVLSGFVIQYSYEKKYTSTSAFLLKRFIRIYIPLFIVFIANYATLSIGNNELININYQNLFGNIFMLQDSTAKPNILFKSFLGNLPLWSLSYEWWFYILFIVISKKIKKNKSIIVYIIGTISAITYLYYPNFINRILMYFIIWWMGVDLARLYSKNTQISFKTIKIPLIFLLLNILILIFNVKLNYRDGATVGISPVLELRHFIFAFVSVSSAIIWKQFKWISFNYTIGLFEPLAKISFVLYISHWFLIVKTDYLNSIVNNDLGKYLIGILICLLFSYMLEIIIYPKLRNLVMLIVYKYSGKR